MYMMYFVEGVPEEKMELMTSKKISTEYAHVCTYIYIYIHLYIRTNACTDQCKLKDGLYTILRTKSWTGLFTYILRYIFISLVTYAHELYIQRPLEAARMKSKFTQAVHAGEVEF